MISDHSKRLLNCVEPLAGLRVLDLGCGADGLTDSLADAVGSGGYVVAGDVGPQEVRRAHSRLAQRPNVSVVQLDATALPLPPRSVDVVVVSMGLMLIGDMETAMREIHRVLRSGGWLGASVWGAADDNPWLTLLGAVLKRLHLVPSAARGARGGGPFALGSCEIVERLLTNAGFVDVVVERVDSVLRCADHLEYLEKLQAVVPTAARAVERASTDQLTDLHRTLATAVERYRRASELHFPVSAIVCRGTAN